MKVLVACEESQRVCIAFRERGFEAYSCDIQECSGGHPEWHIKDDVLKHLTDGWDLMVAHPPCDDIAVCGARHFHYKKEKQKWALLFVYELMHAPIESICIENPVSIISTHIRKPEQIIEPWMFGDMQQKKTCLWLKNLPLLRQSNNVYETMMLLPYRERAKVHYMPPGANRKKLRSKTFPGIAAAMANQWGDYLIEQMVNKNLTLQATG